MKIDDKIKLMIDTEIYSGIVKRIDDKTVDVLCFMGLITNVPINEVIST
jgi:hypothetical protein